MIAFPLTLRPWLLTGLAILLFASVFGLFSPSIHYGFVYMDDHAYVVDNPLVLSGLSIHNLCGAFSPPPSEFGMYLPLLWISYMADVTLFGASASNPAPFHAVNVALHAADAVLFFLLLLRFSRLVSSCPVASIGSSIRHPASNAFSLSLLTLLWALHPLRVESVAWIAERKDSLSLFFALLSLLAYLQATARPRSGNMVPNSLLGAFSLGVFGAALLVKPTLVPFPLLLLAIDRLVFGRPFSWRFVRGKIPFFLLSAAAALATLWGHRLSHPPVPLGSRLGQLPQTLAHYLDCSLFPRHLSVLVPDPAHALVPALCAVLLLGAILFCAFRLRHRAPLFSLGILWYFLFLLPVSGLSAIPNTPVADRFSYVSALGLSIALIPLFNTATFSPRIRHTATALLAVALLGFSVLSLRLLPNWRSGDALYARARLFSPRHRILLSFDFGRAFASGAFPAARDIAAAAMAIHPDAPQFAVFHAMALANTDGPEEAFGFLASRRPASGQYLGEWAWEMASLALRLGRPAEAIAFADLAESELPASSDLHGNLSRLRAAANAGAPADALPHYMSQWKIHERTDALEFFRRLVAAYPSRPDVLANVAWILSTADWSPAPPSEAVDLARRALALVSGTPPPELLDTLAAALANADDFHAAVAAQERAISLLSSASPSRPDYLARLALYRRAAPYRHDIGTP